MESTKTNHSYLSKIIIVITLFMAAVMFAQTPLVTLATAKSSNLYVNDVIMISVVTYLKNGKSAAERAEKVAKEIDKNYVLCGNEPIYKGENKSTFLAYRTTTDGSEAITDIKAMNMKGGWSYKEYQDYIDNMRNDAKKAVDKLMVALNEFREEYKKDKNKGNVKIAYEILNRIKDTDLEKDNGLADIMLRDDFNKEKFSQYYLEGNSKMVALIETALVIACSYTNEVNFIENLNEFDFEDDYETSQYAEYTKTVLSQLKNIKTSVKLYMDSDLFEVDGLTEQEVMAYLDTYVDDDEGYESEYDEHGGLLSKEEKQLMFTIGMNIYPLIKDVPYKTVNDDTVYTLLDFVLSDLDIYAVEDIYPLISGMSDGQRALISTGLDQLISLASQSIEQVQESYNDILKKETGSADDNTYDLYAGVNRRIYNPDGIAMTSEALAAAAEGDTEWAQVTSEQSQRDIEKGYDGLKFTGIFFGGGVAATVFVGLVAVGLHFLVGNSATLSAAMTNAALPLGIAFLAVVVIACIVMLIINLVLIDKAQRKPQVNKWADIPPVMCSKEVKGSNTRYVYYDAVKNDKGEPMDVGNKENQNPDREWVALYTTKDSRMGNPISADSLVIGGKAENVTGNKKYVKIFNNTAALDLNQYNECSTKAYLRFENVRDYVKTSTKTGSVFSQASSWGFAAAGLALGLVGGTIIGVGVKRKKESNDQ